MGLSSASELLGVIPGNVDVAHIITMAKHLKKAGKSYGQILSKLKIPYIYVSMVAVRKEYQGKGFMRKFLEIAFEEGRKQALPVVLDTDAVLKKTKYEHLGMKCVTTSILRTEWNCMDLSMSLIIFRRSGRVKWSWRI